MGSSSSVLVVRRSVRDPGNALRGMSGTCARHLGQSGWATACAGLWKSRDRAEGLPAVSARRGTPELALGGISHPWGLSAASSRACLGGELQSYRSGWGSRSNRSCRGGGEANGPPARRVTGWDGSGGPGLRLLDHNWIGESKRSALMSKGPPSCRDIPPGVGRKGVLRGVGVRGGRLNKSPLFPGVPRGTASCIGVGGASAVMVSSVKWVGPPPVTLDRVSKLRSRRLNGEEGAV